MEATASIFLETHRKNADGEHSLKLRITYRRTRKYYGLNNYLKKPFMTRKAYEKATSKNPRGIHRDHAIKFNRIVHKAETIIEKMPSFSFARFEDEFFGHSKKWTSVSTGFDEHIKELEKNGQFKYAVSLRGTQEKIKQFVGANRFSKLSFVDIDHKFLTMFEKHIISEGKSQATSSLHLRNLRVIISLAIKTHGLIIEYPFENFKIKKTRSHKRALSVDQLRKLFNYTPKPNSPEQFALDMFKFSFFMNGANLGDIFRLKHKNIRDGQIVFSRKKTESVAGDIKIVATLLDSMKEIISRWGSKSINPDEFVFPVLSNDMDLKQQTNTIGYKIRAINRQLKSVASKLGIENISSIYARHSRATYEAATGRSYTYIQQLLGHSSPVVTQGYISSLPSDIYRNNALALEKDIYGNSNQ